MWLIGRSTIRTPITWTLLSIIIRILITVVISSRMETTVIVVWGVSRMWSWWSMLGCWEAWVSFSFCWGWCSQCVEIIKEIINVDTFVCHFSSRLISFSSDLLCIWCVFPHKFPFDGLESVPMKLMETRKATPNVLSHYKNYWLHKILPLELQ